ncbi:sensor domain-containing diguanylate cyclase [Roseibium aggregatum]|uniref:sensor domain-containing diguanylate cyclase n=1 Tax=Roseibium aggregatum TaxID=187304 RepID=UPI001A8C3F54|nr:diguanylate cyclase [Roseibium aggregatum]MBN8184230.1 GGDEF domain-containing protein [Roseibium aggregatum]UES42675.1 diguanylate cyclase [Roseibium aggregatum]
MIRKPISRITSVLIGLRDGTSLRQQIALLAASLCIFSIAVAAFGAALIARGEAIRENQWDLTLIARSMAQRLDQTMFDRYREVRNVADMELLKPVWTRNPDIIRETLDQLQRSLPQYAWIGFASVDGTVVAATKGMLEGASVAERPWFISGLKGPAVEDVHLAKLLDHLLRTSPDEAPFRFVDVAMPVKDENGKLAGVLGAHMSWSWAEETRRDVLENNLGKEGLDLFVLARDGTVLVGEDAEGASLSRETAAYDPGNPDMVVAEVETSGLGDYPGLGWKVAVQQPVSVVSARVAALVRNIFLIGFAVACLSALLAWLASRTISQPLLGLVSALDRIGRDEKETTVPRLHGFRELSQVSASVRSLLRRLGTVEESARTARDMLAVLKDEYSRNIRSSEERNRQLGADIRSLRTLAERDSLSGLLNRRAFQPFAEDAFATFQRHDRLFSVLMIDADHFKAVNDQFGHRAGDDVIRAIGDAIVEEIRSTDKAARFGGEEFVLLLRENDANGAWVLAERIRLRIAALTVDAGVGNISVTVSIGLAEVTADDRDVEDTIARADQALYIAKSSGRNRVCVDYPTPRSQSA